MTGAAQSASLNETCPWSGKPVQPDSLILYRGHMVGFCNPGCRDKFAAAVARFDAAIGTEAGPTLLQLAGARAVPVGLREAALVIIDAQEEYRSGGLPLSGIAAAVERLAALLAAARAAGTPVIHVVHQGRAGGLFDLAAPGGAVLAELQPLPGETVIAKGLPNAFAGTGLDERLRAIGRPGLLLAGFMTHMCVRTDGARGARPRAPGHCGRGRDGHAGVARRAGRSGGQRGGGSARHTGCPRRPVRRRCSYRRAAEGVAERRMGKGISGRRSSAR